MGLRGMLGDDMLRSFIRSFVRFGCLVCLIDLGRVGSFAVCVCVCVCLCLEIS